AFQRKVWILSKFGFRNKSQILDLFRHSKAMHLVQANVNLIYIRDFLGHESVKTTEIYAKADSAAKREALEKASEKIIPESRYKDKKREELLDWLKEMI
ncbi:tyrosine-type recombinase/integrase, partial [Lachnospiraceae bacterium 48-42]